MVFINTQTLKEFILSTTQLTNTGKQVSIKIFKTNEKKIIRGQLVGYRPSGSDFIQFVEIQGKKMEHDFQIPIEDIETESQMRFMIRNYLLGGQWKFIGTTTQKI